MSIPSDGPIGVFDSGVGGLSVLRALWEHLPNERYYYVADSLHCPYADHSPEEIQALSLGIADHLCDMGAKAIVVACNTASAGALTALRAHHPRVPIVGMVPALKAAVGLSQRATVGVLATQATISGELYREVQERFASEVQVIAQACPGLVEQIEAGEIGSPATEALLKDCLAPIIEAQADVLVLGCTHYPFVIPMLRRILGPEVLFLEPSDAVARQTGRVLAANGLEARASAGLAPETVFATTGDPAAFERTLRRLLGIDRVAIRLRWEQGRLLQVQPLTSR
jgi:glutamate racemase